MEADSNRVICYIDMDCFYVEVERALDASLVGLPVAVCQYETWRRDTRDVAADACRRVVSGGAGLIAVSYEARAMGVTRQMQAAEARAVPPRVHSSCAREFGPNCARTCGLFTHAGKTCRGLITVMALLTSQRPALCVCVSLEKTFET